MFEILEIVPFNNPFLILGFGLLMGLIHSFEPDHISAISTQLLDKKKSNSDEKTNLRKISFSSSLRGMFWGMGHTSSILFVGLLIGGFSLTISSVFFLGAEMIVGVLLISLAIVTVLKKNIVKFDHIHPHQHGDKIHTHHHLHTDDHKHGHKSYLIGCIHGLAGSGSVVVLAASSLNSFESILFFLIIFGIGSIIGMTTISGLLGIPFALILKVSKMTFYLRYVIASIAFGFGIFIVFSIISNIPKIGLN
ncbi:MAG: high frequency lysogenization protein HflD [Candidatus Nitrosomaritimum yanchengensis]